MKRRALPAVLCAALLLGGCGFHLRSQFNYAFERAAVLPEDKPGVADEVRRALGDVAVPRTPASGQAGPQVIVDLVEETRDSSVVGINAIGQVLELQLRLRARFKLRTAQGQELIPETEITRVMDVSYSESEALSKQTEEDFLYRDMQRDIAQQILRRLAAVHQLP